MLESKLQIVRRPNKENGKMTATKKGVPRAQWSLAQISADMRELAAFARPLKILTRVIVVIEYLVVEGQRGRRKEVAKHLAFAVRKGGLVRARLDRGIVASSAPAPTVPSSRSRLILKSNSGDIIPNFNSVHS